MAGWLHYWRTFRQPWPFVVGFAAAAAASRLLYEALCAAVALTGWQPW